MIKALFFSAALLALGIAAYAANPTANLSVQIVPAASGSVPGPAAAAGFTTLVLDADFSQPSYATRSNWLDCAGASNPQWWRGWPGFGNIGGPCDAIKQATDPLTGQPALQISWQDSYQGSGGPEVTQIGTGNINNNTHLFPPFLYIEVVARSDSATTGHGFFGAWTIGFTVPPFTNEGAEWDGIEVWAPNDSDIAYHNNVNGAAAYFGNYPPGNDIDTTQYHTYAWRVTSDGSTDSVMCAYIDGSSTVGGQPNACQSWNPDAAQIRGSTPQGLYLQVGLGRCPSSGPCNNGRQLNFWIKSAKVWSCAGPDSGAKCFSGTANP